MQLPTDPNRRVTLLALVLLLASVAVLALTGGGPEEPKDKKLSEVVELIDDGKVKSASILTAPYRVEVKLEDGTKVAAEYPPAYAETLTDDLLDADVPTSSEPPEKPSTLATFLSTLIPLALFLAVLVWLLRSGTLTGGTSKMTGNRGKQLGEVPTTRFSDVAGCDEAITELTELVEFLNSGDRFAKVGAKPPRGALLCGPPGTGKTLLARAVAGEAGVPFFPLAGSDFVETYVGVGARRVRDLFDRARKAGGAIIFIDEIDAVGRRRSGNGGSGGDSERENTLISMLNEMDGFDSAHRIIVLAATNRPDILDPALTRPGRLDRQVQVPNPDRRGRAAILAVHTRNRPVAADVDLTLVARRTPGMSGAELEQLVNEACMEAARRGLPQVDDTCFDAAVATVALGRARTSALVTEHDRTVTAWHEAGHTVAAFVQPDSDDPVSVSIVPRGPAGGVTWMSGNDDVFLPRKKALAQLRVSMAGRVAEQMLLDGEYTQGAHGDLTSASDLALKMVTQYGMSKHGFLLVDSESVRMGGDVSTRVRMYAEELLQEAYEDAWTLLHDHRDFLIAVATELLEHETLIASQIRDLHRSVTADQDTATAH